MPENGKTRFARKWKNSIFSQKLDFKMAKTRFFDNIGRVWLPNTSKWKQKLPFSGTVINKLGKKCKNLILYGENPIKMTTYIPKLD